MRNLVAAVRQLQCVLHVLMLPLHSNVRAGRGNSEIAGIDSHAWPLPYHRFQLQLTKMERSLSMASHKAHQRKPKACRIVED